MKMDGKKYGLCALVLVLLTTSCRDDGDNANREVGEVLSALPQTVNYPASNPYSAEKETLGRLLFWDPLLSGNRDISCATCHHPNLAYADGIALSQGVNGVGLGANRTGGVRIIRNAPTIINTAFNGINNNGNYTPEQAPMFWDSRVNSLEEQALKPMLSKEEMRGDAIAEADIMNVIVSRLEGIAEYQSLFQSAFGSNQITEQRILQAIATFERGINANNSRFDQFMRGNANALSATEIQGMNRFVNVGCADCHSGPMLSDYELHTLGVQDANGITDAGANGSFDFRTPTLRNIGLTAPYMHNGEFATLRDVLDFYRDASGRGQNQINDQVNRNQLDDELRNLNLDRGDINEIIVFLHTLTDQNFDKTIPASVPSNLTVGGNINQ
jgi:cytochrome c peroxidase